MIRDVAGLPSPWIPFAALLATLGTCAAVGGEIIRFHDGATAAGLDFFKENGASGRKYLVETMGSGACFLDYDRDGDPDLYLVQGASLPGFTGDADLRDRLYRNEGPGEDGSIRLLDVTVAAGVNGTGYGMGCVAGDVDGDGEPDLLVTNFGPDVLLRNAGDGTFADRSDAAGISDPRWSASAAFGDADRDGDLDLYVTRYVDFTLEGHRECASAGGGHVDYCPPGAYNPVPDSFYRNRGDGTFEEDLAALGDLPPGNGLGVVWTDLNDDRWPDLYVANDATPNFLLVNRRDGTFRNVALLAGAAVNEDGQPEASMGVESSDVNGDGRFDLFVTHLAWETNTLYLNLGGDRFVDWAPAGVGPPSLAYVGFGTAALDYDHDGDPDLLVANGHIHAEVERNQTTVTYAEPLHLLENDGTGRFREVGSSHGEIFRERIVGRGLALADVDGDGDMDAVVTVSRGLARLLLASGASGAWLALDVAGPAVGTGLILEAVAGKRQIREVRAGSSYLSASALTAHFGLADAEGASLEIHRPAGGSEKFRGLLTRRRYRIP